MIQGPKPLMTTNPTYTPSPNLERRALIGFTIGIVVGFVLTVADVLLYGWSWVGTYLCFNLVWFPCLIATFGFLGAQVKWPRPLSTLRPSLTGPGMSLGMGLGLMVNPAMGFLVTGWSILLPLAVALMALSIRLPSREEWPLGLPRLHLRSIMALVAYVALLLGMGRATLDIGRRAWTFSNKVITSESLATNFRPQPPIHEQEAASRLANAARLDEGEIPDGLLPEQRAFLRSLEGTATPEYKKQRYQLMEKGERDLAKGRSYAAKATRMYIDHFDAMAAKYRLAARHPWRTVPPDPPVPTP